MQFYGVHFSIWFGILCAVGLSARRKCVPMKVCLRLCTVRTHHIVKWMKSDRKFIPYGNAWHVSTSKFVINNKKKKESKRCPNSKRISASWLTQKKSTRIEVVFLIPHTHTRQVCVFIRHYQDYSHAEKDLRCGYQFLKEDVRIRICWANCHWWRQCVKLLLSNIIFVIEKIWSPCSVFILFLFQFIQTLNV